MDLTKHFPQVFSTYPKLLDRSQWVTFSAERIGDGEVAVTAAPGNATEYRFLLFEPKDRPSWRKDCYLVVMDPSQYAWKRTVCLHDLEVHPSYLMEKLGMNEADAVAFSMILQEVGKAPQFAEQL